MPFVVRSFDPATAQIHEQVVEAASREVAQRSIAPGLVLLSVLDAPIAKPRLAPSRSKLDVAWWCRELKTLLSAGMTVVEALETLNAQSLGQERARVNSGLVEFLRQGQALSTAMTSVGEFPSVLVAGVKASERTSSLTEALDDYLRYHEMLEQLRKKVVSAAIYPAVVVSLGGAITLFLLLFVIPRFSRMYSDLHGPVSWTTKLLLSISELLNKHGTLVLVAVVGLCVGLIGAWRTGRLQSVIASIAQNIQPLQVQLDEFRLAKLYHSLALMFRGGYALDEALLQCVGLGLGSRLEQGVLTAQQGLMRGQRVSTAFADGGLTDVVTQRLLAVGERTGNFDRVLQTIAERHSARFTTFIERATRVVEPVLLLTVALMVGGIVIMMYMPVFDIASSVH